MPLSSTSTRVRRSSARSRASPSAWLAGCRQLGRPQGEVDRVDHAQRCRPRPRRGGRRPDAARGLAAENVLVVRATMAYSHDGQGLHRATDPADRRDYVYGHLFLDAAPSVYACFDQPDLKAPYDVTVTAPTGLGRPRQRRRDPDGARPVEAGDDEAARDVLRDGVRWSLRLRAGRARRHLARPPRASLVAEPLERHAAEIFEVTRRSFDYFHGLFGTRYPFGEYHQVFVPEFNAGAMENPGLRHLPRPVPLPRAATRDELLSRATRSPTRCRTCGSATS